MLALLALTAVLVAACFSIGQGVLALCGYRRGEWWAPAVGYAVLLILFGQIVHVPHHQRALLALAIAAAVGALILPRVRRALRESWLDAMLLGILLILLSTANERRHALRDQPAGDAVAAGRVRLAYGHLPLSFEANRGQAPTGVNFTARGEGYSLALSGGDARLNVKRPASLEPDTRGLRSHEPLRKGLAVDVRLRVEIDNGLHSLNTGGGSELDIEEFIQEKNAGDGRG